MRPRLRPQSFSAAAAPVSSEPEPPRGAEAPQGDDLEAIGWCQLVAVTPVMAAHWRDDTVRDGPGSRGGRTASLCPSRAFGPRVTRCAATGRGLGDVARRQCLQPPAAPAAERPLDVVRLPSVRTAFDQRADV
jgi:hypothetical protein